MIKQTELHPDNPDWIKVISLWRPWAYWVMLGWKPVETRLHGRFRGLARTRIGIHAAQKWDADALQIAAPYLTAEQIALTVAHRDDWSPGLLGTVFVRDVRWLSARHSRLALIECVTLRCGLFLAEPIPFTRPLPMKGQQGIWRATLPAAP